MPGFCTPWPGNSRAIGPERLIMNSPRSWPLRPLQERGAPRESRSKPREQNVVAGLDPALAHGLFERQRDGGARRVAVLVDVDRDALHRQADAARGRVADAEAGPVRHPQVDLVEAHTRRLADPGRPAEAAVDRELAHICTD